MLTGGRQIKTKDQKINVYNVVNGDKNDKKRDNL